MQAPHEDDHLYLARLIEWARELSPVTVVRSGSDQPPAGIDIDRVVGEGSIEALSSALSGQNAAYESGLAIPGIARIARRSGVTSMTTDPILPALLVALET